MFEKGVTMQTQTNIGYLLDLKDSVLKSGSFFKGNPSNLLTGTNSNLEEIGDAIDEKEVITAQLRHINSNHLKTGCEGTLSVFVGNHHITNVKEALENPNVFEENTHNDIDIAPKFNPLKNSRTYSEHKLQEELEVVNNLDTSVDYSTLAVNFRVGCDCCEIAWERATQGLFKSKKTLETGKSFAYDVRNDPNYTDTSFDMFSNYDSVSGFKNTYSS